ncbi:MAG: hypothetical protein Crog4KO_12180 [Crocinitomicaceae bacterium]
MLFHATFLDNLKLHRTTPDLEEFTLVVPDPCKRCYTGMNDISGIHGKSVSCKELKSN